MSVTAVQVSNLTVTEVIDTNVPFASATARDKEVIHNLLNESVTLNSGTTPPATKVAGFQKALTSGAATIDLRALVGTNGAAIDGVNLKVRMVRFRNPSGNANNITLTFGASNPYLLHGTAWSITLTPGQTYQAYLKDGAPTIDATHKTIDLAGTGSQALDCLIVLG